jgi:hypothetical protein
MIISHHHKFIFLRSCKTGSTSTALALRRSGILNLHSDVSNFIEGPVIGRFRRPLNMPSRPPSESQFANIAPHTLVWLNPAKRLMHLNLPELAALDFLSAQQTREYKVYVGIREPVDKMISAAHFLLSNAPGVLFEKHKIARPRTVQEVFDNKVINVTMPILAIPQCHWFKTDNPEHLRFLLFDDLQNEVTALINRYRGTWSANRMPREKSGARDKQTDTARNLLRPETVAQLREEYRQDYQLWNKVKQRQPLNNNGAIT